MERYELSLRAKTHMGQRLPKDLVPKVIHFFTFLRKMFHEHVISPSNIIAMDETCVFFDSVSNKTINPKGEKTISMATTGHEKANISVVLTASADGLKRKPYVIFKGKGLKGKEDLDLKKRRDVHVFWSNNGWSNDLVLIGLGKISIEFKHQLLSIC